MPSNSSPRNLHFVLAVFSSFPLIINIFIFFSLFPFFVFEQFLFRATLLIVIYILNPVAFSVAQKSPANTIFPLNRNFFFFNRFIYFFTSFLPLTFLMYYPFQARLRAEL